MPFVCEYLIHPWVCCKTKMSLGFIHNEVYFCNIILQTTLPSFAPWSFLTDNHCELQSEFFAIVANVRIGWTSFRVFLYDHTESSMEFSNTSLSLQSTVLPVGEMHGKVSMCKWNMTFPYVHLIMVNYHVQN